MSILPSKSNVFTLFECIVVLSVSPICEFLKILAVQLAVHYDKLVVHLHCFTTASYNVLKIKRVDSNQSARHHKTN